jgi:hypothetical protein
VCDVDNVVSRCQDLRECACQCSGESEADAGGGGGGSGGRRKRKAKAPSGTTVKVARRDQGEHAEGAGGGSNFARLFGGMAGQYDFLVEAAARTHAIHEVVHVCSQDDCDCPWWLTPSFSLLLARVCSHSLKGASTQQRAHGSARANHGRSRGRSDLRCPQRQPAGRVWGDGRRPNSDR